MNVTALLVPAEVVAVTLTAPAACAGVVAVIWVPPAFTETPVAAEPPKDTLAPARFVPAIVTAVPPAVLPELGVMLLSVGSGGGGAT